MLRPVRVAVLAVTVAAIWAFAYPGRAFAQQPIDLFLSACPGPGAPNPYLITTCFQQGMKGETEAALVAFQNTADDSEHVLLATAAQVGAVYGLAYHARDRAIYAGAFHKRGTHFGPAGPGGIYRIDLSTGAVTTFTVVPNAGTDTHDPSNDYYPDQSGRYGAGVNSLGDVDLNDDGSELFVVNLSDRRIYRYRVLDGQLLSDFPHGAAGEDWAEADARPFGLGFREGVLYHGVVRTAQSSQNPEELGAFVYASNPDGGDMRLVAETGLVYERGWFWPNEGRANWNPWVEPPGNVHPDYGRYAMPILADIEFTASGDQMILGFRDRFGDLTFYNRAPTPPPPGERFNNVPAGDILPAWPEGDLWRIQIDPEYYTGDYGPNPQGSHDETRYGGLVLLPGTNVVAMSANSPRRTNSAGVVWLDTTTGASVGREELYSFGVENYGKANGLGDMDVICAAPDQPTETPAASATSTDVPTATASVPPPSGTPTSTLQSTVTPAPTGTPTQIGPTPTASRTRRPDEPEAPTSPPATPELPGLPTTGSGPGSAWPLVSLLAASGALVGWAAWRRQRPSRVRLGL